jgi:hypothetical protein
VKNYAAVLAGSVVFVVDTTATQLASSSIVNAVTIDFGNSGVVKLQSRTCDFFVN